MPLEVRPLGVGCNIRCRYCYQNPQRDAGSIAKSYDIDAMKEAIEKEKKWFVLFGGEPLLVPIEDLERLWSWGWQKFQKNGIQTNGVLINEQHIKLFKKYRVGVGISVDGPEELNDVRWAGTLEATRAATKKTDLAIRRLCAEGVIPSLIVTLHRANASKENLPRLASWLQDLERCGIKDVRLHILEVDNALVRERYALSSQENIDAFLYLAQLEKKCSRLRFDVFREIRRLLIGDDKEITCIWSGCDPYTTNAVRGIEGHGQRSNCGRTNKEGIDFVKCDRHGFERYLALQATPQSDGGCNGCRFFVMCKGQCPGTAIQGDWRNRSEHCLVWKALFEYAEEEMRREGNMELLSDADRRFLEDEMVNQWAIGSMVPMHVALSRRREGMASV